MNTQCAWVMEAIWLTTSIAVPLVLNPWGCSAFELPKTRLLIALALIAGLTMWVQRIGIHSSRQHSLPRRCIPLLGWQALAFFLAQALSTAFSVDPRISLWGSHARQQGLLTLSAYVALFLLVATGLRTRDQVMRLLAAVSWGSAPVIAYSFVQAAGLDPLNWRTDAVSPIVSTIGRSNFLASYLVLIVPLTATCLILARRRWPYVLLCALQLLVLALTQARSAWIGFGASMLTCGLAWAWTTRSRRLAIAPLAMAIGAVGCVVLLNWPGDLLAPLSHLPGLERLASMTRTDAGSGAARLITWRATLPLIAARPWLGYGPETMWVPFRSVYPSQLVYYEGRHNIIDRAHNVWLDVAMSGGVASLIAFGALLVGFGRLVWRGLCNASDLWERAVWVGLTAAIVGHLADLQFSFDLTASATTFWLVLGLAGALGRNVAVSVSGPDPLPWPRIWLSCLLPTLGVLAFMLLTCLLPLLADAACWHAQMSGRLAAAEQAVRYWPLAPEYRLQLARMYLESGDLDAAEVQLTAVDKAGPDDPDVWAMRGQLYALRGASRSGWYSRAERAFRHALGLAPNIATYHAALGLVLARQGRLEEGVAELERAVALDATDSAAFRHLADLYQAMGRDAQADRARRIWLILSQDQHE